MQVVGGAFVAIGLTLIGSAGVAYLGHRIFDRRRSAKDWSSLAIEGSPKVRLLTAAGARLAHYVGETSEGITISPPIGIESPLPLFSGDQVFVQLATPEGLRVFRSTVIRRVSETGDIILERPMYVRTSNRRSEPRRDLSGTPIYVDGLAGSFVDLSVGGAQLLTTNPLRAGDRVVLEWEECDHPMVADVLDCKPELRDRKFGFRARVCFSEAFETVG
ncbi:MAG: PilZ domain-containing protein [Fimbriimonadaceae bacterium]|nr:PilZ domain-containing protein [Fimbriimonadaceae bacterium]